ncbi:primosomal protein N', partial [Candidatus Peregrinibacteria bacterium]|nr:primosomal protein N' [Candidatus Peregrinibacteria bacterium]
IGLNIPDFKSSERTFQLLTQVAGRAGRSKNPGEVVIQTYSPDHPALQAAETHNFNLFYNQEREQRKLLSYPPFTHLAQVTFTEKILSKAKEKAEALEQALKKIAPEDIIEIISYPAFIIRLHNKYRYRVLIKGESPSDLIKLVDKTLLQDARIDIDPIHTN